MPVLIDGHNLIGQLSSVSLDDPDDEEALVRLLRIYRAQSGKAVTVIFDPGPGSALLTRHRVGGVDIRFAPPGSTADALITRRVSQNANPSSILVITSDRNLADQVRGMGARVQDAREFGAILERNVAGPRLDGAAEWREQPPSPEEVDAWLTLFEENDRDTD